MPLPIIALLFVVICAAAMTIWLFTVGNSAGLFVLPIAFLVAALAVRMRSK